MEDRPMSRTMATALEGFDELQSEMDRVAAQMSENLRLVAPLPMRRVMQQMAEASCVAEKVLSEAVEQVVEANRVAADSAMYQFAGRLAEVSGIASRPSAEVLQRLAEVSQGTMSPAIIRSDDVMPMPVPDMRHLQRALHDLSEAASGQDAIGESHAWPDDDASEASVLGEMCLRLVVFLFIILPYVAPKVSPEGAAHSIWWIVAVTLEFAEHVGIGGVDCHPR